MKEDMMSEEAFNELVNGFEYVATLTKYGRESIKYHIQRLQQENQQLKNNINKLQKELNEENLQCSKYSIELNNLKEKNKQLKDNWDKLREWIVYNKHNENTEQHYLVVDYGTLLGRMQELEQGSGSNE